MNRGIIPCTEYFFENNIKDLHSGDFKLLDDIVDILSNGNYDLVIINNNRYKVEDISEIDIDVDEQRIYFRTNYNISMLNNENYNLLDFKNNLILRKGVIIKTNKLNSNLSIMVRFKDLINVYSK